MSSSVDEIGDRARGAQPQRDRDLTELEVEVDEQDALAGRLHEVRRHVGREERLPAPARGGRHRHHVRDARLTRGFGRGCGPDDDPFGSQLFGRVHRRAELRAETPAGGGIGEHVAHADRRGLLKRERRRLSVRCDEDDGPRERSVDARQSSQTSVSHLLWARDDDVGTVHFDRLDHLARTTQAQYLRRVVEPGRGVGEVGGQVAGAIEHQHLASLADHRFSRRCVVHDLRHVIHPAGCRWSCRRCSQPCRPDGRGRTTSTRSPWRRSVSRSCRA